MDSARWAAFGLFLRTATLTVPFLPQWFESSKIYTTALIIGELSENPSHWSSVKSLDQWLKEQGVPGLQGRRLPRFGFPGIR